MLTIENQNDSFFHEITSRADIVKDTFILDVGVEDEDTSGKSPKVGYRGLCDIKRLCLKLLKNG